MQNHKFSTLKDLEHKALPFWREFNPKPHSCLNLKKLLAVYANFGDWEKVINLSSRAVLHLNKNYERCDFYFIWICGLKETHDDKSLELLGDHLCKMAHEYTVMYCLAALAYYFAGKKQLSIKILKEQKLKNNTKNRFYREAFGHVLSSSKKRALIKCGLEMLKEGCQDKNSNYFSWRNLLRVLSYHNCCDDLSKFYNMMHYKFSFAHEPYLVSTLIAMDESDWLEGIRLLNQILRDNPENTEAILALSQCYEEYGDVEMALEILIKSKHFFHEAEFDFNYSMARLLKKCSELKDDKEKSEDAVLYYDRVVSLANFFRFPVETIEKERAETEKYHSMLNNKQRLLSSLEFFLKEKDPLRLSSIHNFKSTRHQIKIV